MIASLLASCGASLQGAASATITSTTYSSTDEDIYAVEDAYSELEAALNEPFDLIILDVMLPTMDGFEICRAIRKKSKRRSWLFRLKKKILIKFVGLA